MDNATIVSFNGRFLEELFERALVRLAGGAQQKIDVSRGTTTSIILTELPRA